MLQTKGVRLVEPFAVQDIFVSGVGEIEDAGGGCLRFILFAKRHVGDGEEMVVVAKIVVPKDAIAHGVAMTAKAMGGTLQCVCVPRELN